MAKAIGKSQLFLRKKIVKLSYCKNCGLIGFIWISLNPPESKLFTSGWTPLVIASKMSAHADDKVQLFTADYQYLTNQMLISLLNSYFIYRFVFPNDRPQNYLLITVFTE